MIFSFVSYHVHAQVQLPCVDSLTHQPNQWFICYDSFSPVCGCDSQTYRNDCFAYNKAGLNYRRPGVCAKDFYAIDLVPVPVETEPAQFSIAVTVPSSCYIYITDVFGGKLFERTFYTQYNDQVVSFEIDMNDFRNGVYALIAVVDGQKKFRKFSKLKY